MWIIIQTLRPNIWDRQTERKKERKTESGRYRVSPQLKMLMVERRIIELFVYNIFLYFVLLKTKLNFALP